MHPHSNKKIIALGLTITFLVGVILVLVFMSKPGDEHVVAPNSPPNAMQQDGENIFEMSLGENIFDIKNKTAIELSSGKCKGEGPGILTTLPMKFEDFSMIIPYGLAAGGHVTPIDHQYYSPTVWESARDTYEVHAMADAQLTSIQARMNTRGTEYRMVFTMSCTFFYYYDLVTSLAPEIEAAFKAESKNGSFAALNIPVKAGQVIGRIGGQTLDFAVWDLEKPLKGFVVPEHYDAEPWKIYTADPLDYVTLEVKQLMLLKYMRSSPPISGKIDYDIDGRLIGNWFVEGTDYGGTISDDRNSYVGEQYWKGHFSIFPDHFDPTATIISIGDVLGEPRQFSADRSAPNPTDINVSSGMVKYELRSYHYQGPDGTMWQGDDFVKGLKLLNEGFSYGVEGCILLQMIEERKLKLEVFPEQTCRENINFTSLATIYTR